MASPEFLAAELEAAIQAVSKAARICEAVRTSDANQTLTKDDKSPVTVADFAAQAVVISEINKSFPEDGVVGEESASELRVDEGAELRGKVLGAVHIAAPELSEAQVLDLIDRGSHQGGSAGRFWALDPIDGTKGFLRNDQYAVALGLVQDGKVVLGVLGCPNLPVNLAEPEGPRGCVFAARRGMGCEMFPLIAPDQMSAANVFAEDDFSKVRVLESFESGHTAHSTSAQIMAALGITLESVRMDSQAKYGAMARGDGSIYLRLPRPGKPYVEKIWDHVAGSIVVEEAGGKITDAFGKPLDFSKGRLLSDNVGVIATTSAAMHDKVIAATVAAVKAAAQ